MVPAPRNDAGYEFSLEVNVTAGLSLKSHAIAVVNRGDVAEELQALGADAVLQDGPDLADIKEALVHAQQRGRHGKVLVSPNGKL